MFHWVEYDWICDEEDDSRYFPFFKLEPLQNCPLTTYAVDLSEYVDAYDSENWLQSSSSGAFQFLDNKK